MHNFLWGCVHSPFWNYLQNCANKIEMGHKNNLNIDTWMHTKEKKKKTYSQTFLFLKNKNFKI